MIQPRVLIVDDEQSIVYMCQRILSRAGFATSAQTDPMAALALLKEASFDLLLVDILMPVMDGFELITEGRKLQPEMAVLVMTGAGSADTAVQVLRRGADGLLLKPFEKNEELIASVQQVLDRVRERRDAQRLQVITPLFEVSEALISQTDPQALLNQIMAVMLKHLQTSNAGIYEMVGNEKLVPVNQAGERLSALQAHTAWKFLLGQHLNDGEKWLFTAGAGEDAVRNFLQRNGLGSLLVTIQRREQKQFVFYAARNMNQPAYEALDLEVLVVLARQAVIAMENAQLYTDLRASIVQLQESNRALIQSEKLAAVGRMVASVSHELKNPLQTVQNCLSLADRPDVAEDRRSYYLQMAQIELDRLTQTLRRMLEFYRPAQAEREYVQVDALVMQVLDLMKAQLRDHQVEVSLALGEHLPPAPVVSNHIVQVLFNLILNAIDAMEGSRPPRRLWIDLFQSGPLLCLRVEDSGPGVDLAQQNQIFEPFFSTKTQGTGLGLSVSYGIIESHRGLLHLVPPSYGSGACFEIQLPIEGDDEQGANSYRR